MKLVFSFVHVFFILVNVICGEKLRCDVLKTGSCVHTIQVSITSDLNTFTVYNRSSNTKNVSEITAVCDWAGYFFLCDTKKDINYNAMSRTQVSFTPTSGVGCLDGNFTLNTNDHGNFTCIEKSAKSRSKSTDNTKKQRGNKGDTVKGHQKPLEKDSPGKNVNFFDFAMIIPVIEIAVGLLVVIVWSIRRAALL